jgi:hypothetical protein
MSPRLLIHQFNISSESTTSNYSKKMLLAQKLKFSTLSKSTLKDSINQTTSGTMMRH